jgi:hypothetical protein
MLEKKYFNPAPFFFTTIPNLKQKGAGSFSLLGTH